MQLIPTPDFVTASGVVELSRSSEPFGVAVTADGHLRYRFRLDLSGLPDPSTIGPYSAYVAWVTTPLLRPMIKLGEVRNGQTITTLAGFNKFLVFVTAEATADVAEREGRMVLRGTSPSVRLQPHDLVLLAPMAMLPPRGGTGAATHTHAAGGPGEWSMPPMHPAIQMPPGMMNLKPGVRPFLPTAPPGAEIPEATPRRLAQLSDGDTLDLEAGMVRRTINGRSFLMYGFNRQYPGPLIHVPEKATIIVRFTNNIELPTAIHWHGVRLENRFDGVPGVTQDPVQPGETFIYKVHFYDPGIYWYHPHHREDIQQELGLYGNMLVRSPEPDYFGPANREEVVMLDDLLMGEHGLVPFGTEGSTHTLMGRFGNVFLINGEPRYQLEVERGEVVRFFLTNVSNTRTFNLSLDGVALKVVGSDLGKFEREEWVETVVIAPAERYIVEARFAKGGTVAITNRVQAINHLTGAFFSEVDTLGVVTVSEQAVQENFADAFKQLRHNDDVTGDIDRYRRYFDQPVERELVLRLEVRDLPVAVQQLMRLDSVYFNPVEWSGTMPMMNWATTPSQARWIMRDPATGSENTDITDWRFEVGDVVKLRITNDRNSFHAMQHPIHIHGQRFLVLKQNGIPNDNLVWKDTMLLPVGASADILLELTNPGRWMVHCHIAEHLEAGMKMVFEVYGEWQGGSREPGRH